MDLYHMSIAKLRQLIGKNVRVTESGQTGTIDEICYDYDIETMQYVTAVRVRFSDNRTALFQMEQLEISENVKDEPDDPVNHPSHYTDGKYEVIDFIEATGNQDNFYLGNAIKYISRAGKKDPGKKREDLEKAIWYIERYLKWKQDPVPLPIPVNDFIKEKGLEDTSQGFALKLLISGELDLARDALKIALHEQKGVSL